MPSIKELLKGIRVTLKKTPQKIAEELKDPSGNEYGFRHGNGAFMLCRDDKVVELNAGEGSSVIVDGPGQMVNLKSTGVTIDSQTVQFKVPPGNIYFGYQPINPFWFVTNPLDFVGPYLRSPLLCRAPVPPDTFNIAGLSINPLDFIFVSPSPTLPVVTPTGPGTTTGLVPLSNYIHAQPLLGANQQLLSLRRNLSEIVRNIGLMGI